jgi:hypothetical protein
MYTDLTYEWYNTVGPALVQTMLINAFYPLIEVCYTFPMRYAFRILDSGCRKDRSRTKKKTIQ